MKLHDNSRFQGADVVLWSLAKYLKPKRLVEVESSAIRSSDLQEHCSTELVEKGSHQGASHAAPAKIGRHGEIEDFALRCIDGAANQKSRDLFRADGHPEVVSQVVAHVPLGSFARGVLNRRNGVQVGGACPANYWDNHWLLLCAVW